MLEFILASGAPVSAFSKMERLADAPFRLFCNSVVAYGDGFYVMGGFGGPSAPTSDAQSYGVMFYNAKTQEWTRKRDVPDVLNRAPVCLHNGLIWALGATTMMTYDPVADVWVIKQNVPSIRSARMFGYGDYLYIFAGEFNGNSVSEDMRRYHIPTGTLEVVTTPGTKSIGKGYYGAVQDGKYIYLHGGYRPGNQPPIGQFSEFWRYDMQLNTWELLSTAFDVAMHTHQIRLCRGKIVTGGSWSNPDAGRIYEYDIAKRKWVKGLVLPYTGWWLLFETVGDEGYLMGGSSNASFSGATAQIWRLS